MQNDLTLVNANARQCN